MVWHIPYSFGPVYLEFSSPSWQISRFECLRGTILETHPMDILVNFYSIFSGHYNDRTTLLPPFFAGAILPCPHWKSINTFNLSLNPNPHPLPLRLFLWGKRQARLSEFSSGGLTHHFPNSSKKHKQDSFLNHFIFLRLMDTVVNTPTTTTTTSIHFLSC